MNEKENIFGSLENIEPVTNAIPDAQADTSIFSGESNISFTEMPVGGSVDTTPVVDTTYMEEPVAPVAPLEDQVPVEEPIQVAVEPVATVEPVEEKIEEVEVDPASSMSYTEIPVASVTDHAPEKRVETINENPNGKVTLRREEQDLPEIKEPSEAMDKSTIWLLVWLFFGLLAVIIALPYVTQLI